MASAEGISQAIVDEFVGVAHGDFARVQQLLAQHPGLVDARARWGESAVEAAAQTGRADIAEFLLAAGAPLDICTAAMLGRTAHVQSELARDPALANATGAHGIPLLHYPVVRDNLPMAELLLAAGAAVNAGAGSNTPLHGAAWFGRARMAAWLLAHGADPAAVDYEGKTALDRAREQGHAEVVKLLEDRGVTG